MANLDKNRIKKYLIYAFGEIILVVIGILLALQINNWNIKKKESAKLQDILAVIKIDMEEDIEEIDVRLELLNDRIATIDSLLQDQYDLAGFKKCKSCPYVYSSYTVFVINNKGVNQLNEMNFDIAADKDSLYYEILNFYESMELGNDILNEMIKEKFSENMSILQNSQEWYSGWLTRQPSESANEFFIHDPFYKNRLSTFFTILEKNYIPYLEQSKAAMQELLTSINNKIGIKTYGTIRF